MSEFRLKTYSTDPKIIVLLNNIIILKPSYTPYSFITIFIPLAGSLYILYHQPGENAVMLCYFINLFMLVVFIVELSYYNTIRIDTKNKNISIVPGAMWKLISQKKTFHFDEIEGFDYKSNGARPASARYIIKLVLKTRPDIKLISSGSEAVAKHIVQYLLAIVQPG